VHAVDAGIELRFRLATDSSTEIVRTKNSGAANTALAEARHSVPSLPITSDANRIASAQDTNCSIAG
jgi:hypothetical protein